LVNNDQQFHFFRFQTKTTAVKDARGPAEFAQEAQPVGQIKFSFARQPAVQRNSAAKNPPILWKNPRGGAGFAAGASVFSEPLAGGGSAATDDGADAIRGRESGGSVLTSATGAGGGPLA